MIRFAKNVLTAVSAGLVLGWPAWPASAQPAAAPVNLPLYFEAGPGPAQFTACGPDCRVLISPAEAQIGLRQSATARMQFAGADAQASIRGDTELSGKINYFTGSDPGQWRRGVATFARVCVEELYPGINLVYYGNQRQLEYDFTVAPGANPDAIRIHFTGAEKISISPQGELVLNLAGGEILQPKPVIYQMTGGTRKTIEGGYRLMDAHTVAFAVGKYDFALPLVIDPALSYSTYFGGTAGDQAKAVALDTNGCIYITGQTLSKQFRTNGTPFSTPGAAYTNYAGTGDAFVAKFDNLGTNLIYLTYLGGSDVDAAFAIAVDNAGDAYVAGVTSSTNFPVNTTNAYFKQNQGIYNPDFGSTPSDAFVAVLSPNGSTLIYSTYLGGSGMDKANGIALDKDNNIYITGCTYSSDFQPIFNALQNTLACTNSVYYNANAFVTAIGFTPTNTTGLFSTYWGGNNFDVGTSIAVDSSNYIYVTGYTLSTNFPTTNAVHQTINGHLVNGTNLNGAVKITAHYDAFVTKFYPYGTGVVYSTYLGGTNDDMAYSIATDNRGAAYVTGWTISTNFPNTLGTNLGLHSFVATNTTGYLATNVFLTKITDSITVTNSITITNSITTTNDITTTNSIAITNSIANTLTAIAWSAMFGAKGVDIGYGVAVDPAGEVFVTGSSSSTNFPIFNVPPGIRATNSGKSDAFVIAFNTNAASTTAPTNLLYSIRLGGKDNDFGYGIAADPLGNAYIVGLTLSTNFPKTNAFQTFRNGSNDTFLAKIILNTNYTTLPLTLAIAPTNGGKLVVSATTSPFAPELPLLPWFDLESNTNLLSTNWTAVSLSPVLTNHSYHYQLNPTNPAQFFRLH